MSRTGARKTVDRAASEAEARRQAEARRLRNRRLLISAIVAIVLVGAIAFFATRPEPEALANVQTFPNQGQQHIDASAPAPDYNSNPPTSGPHAPAPAPCGIYRQPVPDITQVHDLEHGVVVIQYGPETTDPERQQLEDFARDAGTHVIVAPREGMDQKIAVTAWTKLMTMDTVDIAAIEGFYGQFAQFGPEAGVQCPFQVDESQAG
ncbi:MAG: DUF3105 domain-containing protein [Acidimicrobiia bacterium]